jgi:hypothetical protein
MMKSSKMTYPAIIETPFPTLEETAKAHGVPLARARKLAQLDVTVRHAMTTRVAGKKSGRFVASKNAKKRSAKSGR